MNITTFPNLKRRHIVLWRIVIWLILTFYELPKRILLYLLDFPLAVIYYVCVGVVDAIRDLSESTCNFGMVLVRYWRVSKYLVHAKFEGDK